MACGDQHACTISLGNNKSTLINQVVYDGFLKYFGDLVLTKMPNNKGGQEFAKYGAKIHTMTSDYRYIYVITFQDYLEEGHQRKLSSISWVSFQALTQKVNHELPIYRFDPDGKNNQVLSSKIRQIEETENKVTYRAESLPLKVELLGNRVYHSEGTLKEALDTFNTIVYFSH
jgi:hypothetical protein